MYRASRPAGPAAAAGGRIQNRFPIPHFPCKYLSQNAGEPGDLTRAKKVPHGFWTTRLYKPL